MATTNLLRRPPLAGSVPRPGLQAQGGVFLAYRMKRSRINRWICRLFGHRWTHIDETTVISYEPLIRAVCQRCGKDGGLL